MTLHDIGWLAVGVLLGWITKIPVFLKAYKDCERNHEQMRKWIDSLDKEAEQKDKP